MEETQRKRRGHDFLPSGKYLKQIPDDHETEGTPAGDKIIYLHYFGGPTDVYLAEIWHDSDEDCWMGFGFTRIHGLGDGEWGDVNFAELEQLRVRGGLVIIERDLHWNPVPFWRVEQPFSDYGYDYIVRVGQALGTDPGLIAANCQEARDQGILLTAVHRDGLEGPPEARWATVATALASWPEDRLRKFGLGAEDVPAAFGELDHLRNIDGAFSPERATLRTRILSRFPSPGGAPARTAAPVSLRPSRRSVKDTLAEAHARRKQGLIPLPPACCPGDEQPGTRRARMTTRKFHPGRI